MTELTVANAGVWLSAHAIDATDCAISEAGGGVSNKVLLIEGPPLRAVLKQSLGRLRVEQEWLSDRERIFREAAAMRWLSPLVSGGRIPGILAEDPAEFAILMEAAPARAEMWKSLLFRGETDPRHAESAGNLLAEIVSASWLNAEADSLFGDQTVFHQLRIHPYYQVTAARNSQVAGYFDSVITASAERRVSLVHGDWSPKNLLASGPDIWAIDWEVVHFGDPAFDVAFLWNHLLMKSIALPESAAFGELATRFTAAYISGIPRAAQWIPQAALGHLPALLLARVDGKSPAEYLTEPMRERARRLALELMRRPAQSIEEVFER